MLRSPETAKAKTKHGYEDTERLLGERTQGCTHDGDDDLHCRKEMESAPNICWRTPRQTEDACHRNVFVAAAGY